MINRNSPNAKKIFKAGGYTDRIKNFCRNYILESYEERKITFQKMKSECQNFNDFAQIQFEKNKEAISILIVKIVTEIENLESINNSTEEGNCTVCNTKLKTYDTLISDEQFKYITVCENCPTTIYNLLNQLDWVTGAVFI
jgi:hypothetical protein